MGLFDWLLKKNTQNNNNLSFPNGNYTHEKYLNKKELKKKLAISNFYFWDSINIEEGKEIIKRCHILDIIQYYFDLGLLDYCPYNEIGDKMQKEFNSDKKHNMNLLLKTLEEAYTVFSTKKEIDRLRCCFLDCARLSLYFGDNRATKFFLITLFLDVCDGGILPSSVLKWAFEEEMELENRKKLFIASVEELKTKINYNLPLTPQEAWQKIIEYKEENDL